MATMSSRPSLEIGLFFRVGGHLTEGRKPFVLDCIHPSIQVKAAVKFTTRPLLFEGCFDCNSKGRMARYSNLGRCKKSSLTW